MQSTAADTQALAELLQTLWGHVMKASGHGFLQELEDHDMSLSQLKALHVLRANEQITVKRLGECLQLSLPAASRAVDGLVQRGLVDRVEDATDRRQRLVCLAAPGQDVLDRVETARMRGLAAFVESLPEDQRNRLAAALSPIVEGLAT